MVQFKEAELDAVFAALADRTRRAVLQSLDRGSLSVTELARPYGMSLPGFIKHLRVLEDAGLIARTKEGRVVSCTLAPQPMQGAAMWLSRYEKFWKERLDALARYLYHQQETTSWPKPKKSPRSGSPATSTRPPKKSGKRGPTRKP
jgi:DNA-binding transcriptional ArsR family regulator